MLRYENQLARGTAPIYRQSFTLLHMRRNQLNSSMSFLRSCRHANDSHAYLYGDCYRDSERYSHRCNVFDGEVAGPREVAAKRVPPPPHPAELWQGQFLSYGPKSLIGASLVYK